MANETLIIKAMKAEPSPKCCTLVGGLQICYTRLGHQKAESVSSWNLKKNKRLWLESLSSTEATSALSGHPCHPCFQNVRSLSTTSKRCEVGNSGADNFPPKRITFSALLPGYLAPWLLPAKAIHIYKIWNLPCSSNAVLHVRNRALLKGAIVAWLTKAFRATAATPFPGHIPSRCCHQK